MFLFLRCSAETLRVFCRQVTRWVKRRFLYCEGTLKIKRNFIVRKVHQNSYIICCRLWLNSCCTGCYSGFFSAGKIAHLRLSAEPSSSKYALADSAGFGFAHRFGVGGDSGRCAPRPGAEQFFCRESALNSYRSQQGVNAEYLEAYSWLGGPRWTSTNRPGRRLCEADQGYGARTTETARSGCGSHLPSRWERRWRFSLRYWPRAGNEHRPSSFLQAALRTYGNTSIHDRLQEEPEPALAAGEAGAGAEIRTVFGSETSPGGATQRCARAFVFLGALVRGLQAEAPIITQLRSEFSGKDCK